MTYFKVSAFICLPKQKQKHLRALPITPGKKKKATTQTHNCLRSLDIAWEKIPWILEFLRTCFWLSNHFSFFAFVFTGNTHDLSRFLCSFGRWESGHGLCSEVTAIGTLLWHCSYPPGGDGAHPHPTSWTTQSHTSLKRSDISDSLPCGHSYWKYHHFQELALEPCDCVLFLKLKY